MPALLLQTFAWMALTFLGGAMLGCVLRRTFGARTQSAELAPVRVGAPPVAAAATAAAAAVTLAPRTSGPVVAPAVTSGPVIQAGPAPLATTPPAPATKPMPTIAATGSVGSTATDGGAYSYPITTIGIPRGNPDLVQPQIKKIDLTAPVDPVPVRVVPVEPASVVIRQVVPPTAPAVVAPPRPTASVSSAGASGTVAPSAVATTTASQPAAAAPVQAPKVATEYPITTVGLPGGMTPAPVSTPVVRVPPPQAGNQPLPEPLRPELSRPPAPTVAASPANVTPVVVAVVAPTERPVAVTAPVAPAVVATPVPKAAAVSPTPSTPDVPFTPVATSTAALAALAARAGVQPTAQPTQTTPQATVVATPEQTLRTVSVGDDFTRIRAVDEAMQARLRKAGITRFGDMARWSAADVSRISQELGLVGRIEHESWIEQAQILSTGGETGYSKRRLRGEPIDQPVAAVVPPTAPVATVSVPVQPAQAPGPVARPIDVAVAPAPVAAVPVAPVAPTPVASIPAQAGSAQAAPSSPASITNPTLASAQATLTAAVGTTAAAAAAAASAMARTAASTAASSVAATPAEGPAPLPLPTRLADAIRENTIKPADPLRRDLAGLRSVRSEGLRGSDVTATETQRSGGTARPTGAYDDLKRIRGIGVLIEKKLNSLGITSYAQVANWSNADIDRISQILDFRGRIERESWVEQSRILANGGHTEFSKRVDRGEA